MLSSPRRPDSTIRIFSSDECSLRVARRISFTTCSAGAFVVTGFFIIFNSIWGKDEPQTPRYAITLNCSVGADGGQGRGRCPPQGGGRVCQAAGAELSHFHGPPDWHDGRCRGAETVLRSGAGPNIGSAAPAWTSRSLPASPPPILAAWRHARSGVVTFRTAVGISTISA